MNVFKHVHVFNSIDFISRISAIPDNGTIGNLQDIICLIATTSRLDPTSVTSFWTGPNGVVTNDDRLTIITTVDSNIYTTVLHFDYIWESDEGIYTCNVTTSDHSVSLSTNLSNLMSKLHKYMYVCK